MDAEGQMIGDAVDKPTALWRYALCIGAFVVWRYVNRLMGATYKKEYGCTAWCWANLATASLHSFLCGVWAAINFLLYADGFQDSMYTRILCCIGPGYLLYDSLDTIYGDRPMSNENKWVLIHHIVLTAGVFPCYMYGYTGHAIALSVSEFNSMAISFRKLIRFSNHQKDSPLFRANTALCLGSCLIFRFVTPPIVAYRFIVDQRVRPMPLFAHYLSLLCVFLIAVIGLRFFFVIMTRDVYFAKKTKANDNNNKLQQPAD